MIKRNYLHKSDIFAELGCSFYLQVQEPLLYKYPLLYVQVKIMSIRKILLTIVFLTVGAILTIYLYDILSCIFTDSPIPTVSLTIFLALLIGAISVVIVLKKDFNLSSKIN
jgi:hypothetical protein